MLVLSGCPQDSYVKLSKLTDEVPDGLRASDDCDVSDVSGSPLVVRDFGSANEISALVLANLFRSLLKLNNDPPCRKLFNGVPEKHNITYNQVLFFSLIRFTKYRVSS